MADYHPRQHGKTSQMIDWLHDAGVGERQTVVATVTPEMIPNLKAGKNFVVVNGAKTVHAYIDKGSKIEWSDEENAWVATLVIAVARVDVFRDLKVAE